MWTPHILREWCFMHPRFTSGLGDLCIRIYLRSIQINDSNSSSDHENRPTPLNHDILDLENQTHSSSKQLHLYIMALKISW